MHPNLRRLFPYLALMLGLSAVAWACTFEKKEPADFVFANGTEIQSVDPAKVSGVPEGRIINALFEGLYRMMPDPGDPTQLSPQPALAEGHTLSDDGKIYTFTMREDAYWCKLGESPEWSRSRPITADDFVWSWRRFLHPETASIYAYQLHYVKNGKKYSSGAAVLEIGDRVEIELRDRSNPEWQYPTGTIHSGILLETIPPKPTFDASVDKEEQDKKIGEWVEECVWVVDIKPEIAGIVDWEGQGQRARYTINDETNKENATPCHSLLIHFSEVGIRAPDKRTLVVELENPTHFFPELCAFYPLYPVSRECVEKYGTPLWTKPENIVTCGPYLLESRRIRDRIRLVRNPLYRNAEDVALEVVDALAVSTDTTMLNLYMNGQADWITKVPASVLPTLREERDDVVVAPLLGVYYYRLNTTKPPLDDPRVRRALKMAIDRHSICEYVTRGDQVPARGFVPPGIPNYASQKGDSFDPEGARALLQEAIDDGIEMPIQIQILFNKNEGHHSVAETIMQQWQNNLGIEVELKQTEWNAYLDATRQLDYKVSRAGWIGDYRDANTFLDMFVTGGEHNQTGWSNERYDELIDLAEKEPDADQRLEILHEAENILLEESPILPIYFYQSVNMVRGHVGGFHTNILDIHPLHIMTVDKEERERQLRAEGLR